MDYTTALSFETASQTSGWNVTSVPRTVRYMQWQDYLVFGISLSLPLVIGVFFLITSCRKPGTAEDFLVGERSINFVAVALSLLGSLLNGIFVLGTPAEVRYYGTKVVYVVIGLLLAAIIVSIIFVPKYHAMKFTSAYQYLERRYSFATRVVASITFMASVIIYLAIVLYVPALAFSEVTGVSHFIIIAVAGVICTIYTAMGGIKAVVYTDALQMIILIVGLITISALGAQSVGGGQNVWNIAIETNRINMNGKLGAFNFDPRARNTFWTQSIGQGWTYVGLFVCNQMMIQRYMSVDTATKAQASLILTFLVFIPIAALGVLIGLVINAVYETEGCDPLIDGRITSGDKIVPYFIMQLLGDYYGVPGLLIASIFSAALSSIASVINALSAVFLEDIITPLVALGTKKPIKDSIRKKIAIAIVIFFGLLTIALSFVADKFTSKLVQATGTIWGVIDGPLAGAFIAGFFIPFCNATGAISGIIGGLIIALWISVGGIIYAPSPVTLPVPNCRGNFTVLPPPSLSANQSDWFPLLELYNVTYGWYGVIGIFSSLIINIIVSFVYSAAMELCYKRGWTFERIRKIPSNLMYSCADNLYCYCPESCKRPFRCGVDYSTEEEISVTKQDDKEIDNYAFEGESREEKVISTSTRI